MRKMGPSILEFGGSSYLEEPFDLSHVLFILTANYKENIPIPSLYFAKKRPVVEYMGTKILVDDERMPKELVQKAKEELVRFRTLGCYPLTGAINSSASNVLEIIKELILAKTSERQGRLIDSDEEASMEKKKKEGYF